MRNRIRHMSARRARRYAVAALLALLVAGATAFVAFAASGPPVPTVTASPSAALTNSRSETFNFSSAGAAGYQCALDTTTFTACTSSKTYSALSDGSHTLQVRALDSKGKTSDPAAYKWTVDTVAPVVVGLTRAGGTPTNLASISWTVTFSEPVTGITGARFGLAPSGLGGSPAITGVTGSGFNYTITATTGTGDGALRLDLTNGASQIKDIAGNSLGGSLPVTGESYTLDRTKPAAPSLASKPSDPQSAADGSSAFSFTDAEPVAAFRCAIDAGAESACASPKSYTNLGQGHHVFYVVAVDQAGNRSDATTYAWDIVQPVKDFQISGNAARSLVPGRKVPLNLTVKNSNNFSVTLTSITVGITGLRAPNATSARPCTLADFATYDFNGSVTVPSGTSTLQAINLAESQWPAVMLRDRGSNQGGCKNATFTLNYKGIATK